MPFDNVNRRNYERDRASIEDKEYNNGDSNFHNKKYDYDNIRENDSKYRYHSYSRLDDYTYRDRFYHKNDYDSQYNSKYNHVYKKDDTYSNSGDSYRNYNYKEAYRNTGRYVNRPPQYNDYEHSSRYPRITDLDYISKTDTGLHRHDTYMKGDDAYKKHKSDYKADFRSPSYEQYGTRPPKFKHVSADPNNTIGLFGLHQNTTDNDLKIILEEKLKGIYGYTYKIIMDERTGLCKGFCFIDFLSLNDAISAKLILNNESFRGQDFKCDYSYKHGIMGDSAAS